MNASIVVLSPVCIEIQYYINLWILYCTVRSTTKVVLLLYLSICCIYLRSRSGRLLPVSRAASTLATAITANSGTELPRWHPVERVAFKFVDLVQFSHRSSSKQTEIIAQRTTYCIIHQNV